MEIPKGAGLIEARGHYLIPGLAEMHAHISPTRDREDLNIWNLLGRTNANH